MWRGCNGLRVEGMVGGECATDPSVCNQGIISRVAEISVAETTGREPWRGCFRYHLSAGILSGDEGRRDIANRIGFQPGEARWDDADRGAFDCCLRDRRFQFRSLAGFPGRIAAAVNAVDPVVSIIPLVPRRE